ERFCFSFKTKKSADFAEFLKLTLTPKLDVFVSFYSKVFIQTNCRKTKLGKARKIRQGRSLVS
ncbi:MAG: hypothetical protein J6K71_02280, partial [Clostridia bacterium]|nr:hypothetical protein [Clostridia bacterium]